ncbi:hypothetical protein [Methylobacterium trifolii]|uniref:Uncharacterized protein n=1 Tax=Methylobacterium trifolii TaxID=1003092 RepID=A0ABQ4U4Z8_9HYPH|nr:hypothetical protein [Methylobacterium trifolii]GJE62518.1 hypothetical protein MPOCJGCO_4651 [Methylobacterium trifolii]
MSETNPAPQAAKLTQVADLGAALSDRILNARIAGRQILPEQITALAGAAQLLQDHAVPWPPLMEQVLHEFADGDDDQAAPEAAKSAPEGNGAVTSLSRFLGAFRREKGIQPEA